MKVKVDRLISIMFAVMLFFLILSFSISLPILCRGIYYAHIEPLSLTDSGYTEAEIKTAFGEVMDYLTFKKDEFSCGEMLYSESGKQHFSDCRALFGINFAVLAISGISVAAMLILKLKKGFSLRLSGHTAAFYSAVAVILIPAVLGIFALIDFDMAFELFHLILFPDKTNWEFYPSKDEIINVLPPEFFMNCGAIIALAILTASAIIITCDLIKRKKKNENI